MSEQEPSDTTPKVGDRFWVEVEVKGVNPHYSHATLALRRMSVWPEEAWTTTANWFIAPFAFLDRRRTSPPRDHVAEQDELRKQVRG